MTDKKKINLDALALAGPDLPLSGIVIDARHISRGDVVDMIIGQVEDALKAKVRELEAEAKKLCLITEAEIKAMVCGSVQIDQYHLRYRNQAQLSVCVDMNKQPAVNERLAKAAAMYQQAEAYQQAVHDLVHGKSAKRAILKKFLVAHPEGQSAIDQIEKFGKTLIDGLHLKVVGELEA